MIAIEVEYLTGHAVASQRHDRESAEWPPHPGRLFSALVSAYEDLDTAADERGALLWLEKQRAPSVSFSNGWPRTVVPVFVPINDDNEQAKVLTDRKTGQRKVTNYPAIAESTSFRRNRQERTFPTIVPESPLVYFIWPDVEAGEAEVHRPALARLAANVTYLGHSSSPVRVALCGTPPEPSLEPAERGDVALRVPTPGRLEELEASFERGERPSPGIYCTYARPRLQVEQHAIESVFGEVVVFQRENGSRLPVHACAYLTASVRSALMGLAGSPSEVLSGHAPDGSPSQQPHVAIVPLANVGHHMYADGSIMGFGVVLPRRLARPNDPERRHVAQTLLQLDELVMGSLGVWRVTRLAAESPKRSLRPDDYLGPSKSWATVTPMLLDYVPKKKPGKDAASIVAIACERIGLARPIAVEFGPVSPFRGVPPSAHFRSVRNGKQRQLPRMHVQVEFEAPVVGPVILGAGRYLGLGLCRVLDAHRQRGGKREP